MTTATSPDKIDRAHAIFIKEGESRQQRERDRVLLLGDYNSDASIAFHASKECPVPRPDKSASPYLTNYQFANLAQSLLAQFTAATGYLVEIESGKKRLLGASEKFPLLLPIGYSRIAADSGTLLMGSDFGADDLIGSPTYDAAVLLSVRAA